MLRRLTIRDFVIVDRLDLEFAAGFGALTGETGAGKSILLDALGLALGGRGEAAMVRSGRERADVAAEFDLPAGEGLAAWLVEQELPADEGMLILRRTIDMGGRSRAWINGVAATLAQLRAAGEWLADIHGQHAHHALLRTDAQRALLDAQAGAGALVAEVAARHREWQRLLRLQREAEADSASSARERELLAWQLRELEQVGFDIEEWAEINAEHARLAHAASLIEGAEAAVVALGEGELAVCSVLGRLDGRIAALADFDAGLADVRELISAAAIQADEALHALRRYRDRLDLDPGRLAELERRIAAVMEAARKYRVQPEELPALAQQWRERLDTLEATADPARLAAAAQAARAAFESVAAELTAARLPAARRLSEEIAAAMQDLAMAGGRFEVALARLGQDRQVLCVTHLPQVAACADWQWRIAKREQGGETLSEVAPLDDAARVEEVARMLGGVNITATTRDHAAEMLGRR
ncbi:MAG: DNA repair protein RecN [Alphaproteobacteria bacterium ADurb.BinA305]|nr:MAG: DNA repair protein RecN [Alphaproteobacteria bacterium ADurb.BinA305]